MKCIFNVRTAATSADKAACNTSSIGNLELFVPSNEESAHIQTDADLEERMTTQYMHLYSSGYFAKSDLFEKMYNIYIWQSIPSTKDNGRFAEIG